MTRKEKEVRNDKQAAVIASIIGLIVIGVTLNFAVTVMGEVNAKRLACTDLCNFEGFETSTLSFGVCECCNINQITVNGTTWVTGKICRKFGGVD